MTGTLTEIDHDREAQVQERRFEAIHSSVSAMLKVGAIDKATKREFDETCLLGAPTMWTAEIKQVAKPATSVSRCSLATSAREKAE